MDECAQVNNEYQECYIAVIDILGFSELVKKSSKNQELLPVLVKALNTMTGLPSGEKRSRYRDSEGHWQDRVWRIQTRAFSDCIVIFMPKVTKGISQILFMVRYIHDRMLELELCVRGAITIGKMYWNDAWSNPTSSGCSQQANEDLLYSGVDKDFPITLGPGFIDAYKLESECAIYPRILISRKLFGQIKKEKLSSFPLGSANHPNSLLKDYIRQDTDGIRFLDVLNPRVTRADTERIVQEKAGNGFSIRWVRGDDTNENVMSIIRNLVKKRCKSKDEKIRAKYEWLKSYCQNWNNQEASG